MKRGIVRVLYATVAVVLMSSAVSSADQPKPAGHTPLAQHEAEILIYVLPVAVDLRRGGNDVASKLQTHPSDNVDDYFHFWVVVARDTGSASPNVGYFAVNKWTADVWDEVLDRQLSGAELEHVQAILRKAHSIDAGVISGYRSRPLHR